MKSSRFRLILLIIFTVVLLGSVPHTISAQELGAGAKLVGTTPFIFAEAKLWIFAAEVGVGPNMAESAPTGYEKEPYNLSLGVKIYPIEIAGFSPYLGSENWFSLYYKQTRTFAGIEFNFPSEGVPLSIFGGGDYVLTEAEGASFGWHLGIKYT
ncbi:hypothetical protein KGY79_11365, partial [Candidatus Bipolaricaulota bacterium]|nr:hypothetical protein [Candidatus Bipolaricaulota bacterium]